MGDRPLNILCGSCGKNLNRVRFSNNAMKKYEAELYAAKSRRNNTSAVKQPFCRECTGGSRDEMFCEGCQRAYSLDHFSKAQRSKSDKAKCKTCSQESEDRVADVQDAVQEQVIVDRLENPATASAGAWSTGTMHGALSALGSGYGISGTASDTGRTSTTSDSGAVWINPEQPREGRSSSNGTGGIRGGGSSDSDETNVAVRQVPSTVGARTNSPWDNFTPIETTYRRHRPQGSATSQSTNPGFIKQKAVRATAQERARDTFVREQQRKKQQELDDDDDEDDRDSDDSDDFEL